jgi:hypothetical protein
MNVHLGGDNAQKPLSQDHTLYASLCHVVMIGRHMGWWLPSIGIGKGEGEHERQVMISASR